MESYRHLRIDEDMNTLDVDIGTELPGYGNKGYEVCQCRKGQHS